MTVASAVLDKLDSLKGYVIPEGVKATVTRNYGKTANDHFGWSVSKAGNIDGDSIFEVIVGAPHFDDGAKTDAGKVYVLTTGTIISEFLNLVIPLTIIFIYIAIFRSKTNKKKRTGDVLNER